jgi:hypothetical protein
LLLGGLVILVKLPWLFTTLGEHDQGRLIIDGIVYSQDGSSTLRKYGIITSPLWTLSVAALAGVISASQLVLLSNVGGLLCGGLITALAFVLLRRFGSTRAWASCGALAAAVIPGTFYLSLYGYPSQYAIALLLATAVAFERALNAQGSVTWLWYTLAAALYCALTLTKIDFAVCGTLFLSVSIITRKHLDRKTLLLPGLAGVALFTAYICSRIAIAGGNVVDFMTRWRGIYPWQSNALIDASADTILYSCGLGTVLLFLLGLVWGATSRVNRGRVAWIALAWAVAVLPLWVFWLAHPPMSNRHTVPGALITAILAALVASHAFKGWRYAPVMWMIALIGVNWTLGEPSLDFNYRPSGKLASTLSLNRRAFAVAEQIADDVVRRREPLKIVIGPYNRKVLGGIDFVPFINIKLASQSESVRAINTGRELIFTASDGYETRFFPYWKIGLRALTFRNAGFYSPWGENVQPLKARGLKVVSFDPDEMLLQLERQ